MIRFDFNEKKTTQAAASFIKQSGGKLNHTKLVKLLYLADREALRRWERPITGDSYVSMKLGPVLSSTYELINYPGNSYWYMHIERCDHYDVCIKTDPGTTSLTLNEIDLIKSISEQYKNYGWGDMIKICHECCPEWKRPGDTSIPIRIEDILKALNKTEREIEIIEEEALAILYNKENIKENIAKRMRTHSPEQKEPK